MDLDLRVGIGYDVHPFAPADSARPLILAGVHVEHGPGLDGHSDADAVAHAVADALLGAAGLPDLGSLFPASDPRWRGADSMDLLRRCVDRVHAEGWAVVNVHAVVNAQRPRLAAHVGEMASRLAAVVDAPAQVTPKRGEGLGAVGRAEGIAVWATALLRR